MISRAIRCGKTRIPLPPKNWTKVHMSADRVGTKVRI
jgi:hypothetical protein